MKAKELRGKSSEELGKLEKSLAEELFGLRIKKELGQLRNSVQIRRLRQARARVKTLQSVRNAQA